MKDTNEITVLDLNNAADARAFIREAMPSALPNQANVTHFNLNNGRAVEVDKLSDSEAIQYAWELLPIYQAAFPQMVDVHDVH